MNRRGVVGALALVALTLSGCVGSDPATPRVLHWWVVPDRVDADAIAEACSSTAGDYTIEIEQLAPGIDQRRTEIVRRFAAGDDSIDILSLDTSLTAEIAGAGYLATVPAAVEAEVSGGALPKAVEAASLDGRLVAAPWWLDPQVLWYRGTAAERAGIDTTKPVSWDDLLAGAERLGTTLQIDDTDGNGLADWVRALVAGAGGTFLEGAGREPALGLATDAGRIAAGIVQFYAGAGIGPGPSPDALTEFAGPRGGFLLASSAVVTDPILTTISSDMNAVAYPVIEGESIAPLSGVVLAVPKDAPDPGLAFEAVACLTSAESQQQMMIGSGHGSTRAASYEVDEVKSALSSSELALKAVGSGVNVPSTPYWHRVRTGLRDTWTPISSVSPSTTPDESQRAVADLVGGGLR
ncbi:MAG: extracellular solute-binding protein [Aeromicrobium sp.]